MFLFHSSQIVRGSHESVGNHSGCWRKHRTWIDPNPYAGYRRKSKKQNNCDHYPEMTNSFFLNIINGRSIAGERLSLLIYITHEDVKKGVSIVNHLQNGG